jgi:hypothetical protein
LSGGKLLFDGNVEEGVGSYERSFSDPGGSIAHAHFGGPLSDSIRFERLICKQGGAITTVLDPLRGLEIELCGIALRRFPVLELDINFFSKGAHIASCLDAPRETAMREGPFTSKFEIPGRVFRPGRYTIGVGAVASIGWIWGPDIATLDFSDNTGVDGRSVHETGAVINIPYDSYRTQ